MRAWPIIAALWLAGCAAVPEEPASVVEAALAAAGGGDLEGFIACYAPASAQRLKRAVAAAEGSGWVPAAPLRLLTPGAAAEVHRHGDLAVVEISSREADTAVCLTRTGQGWRLTLDDAAQEDGGWTCRPHERVSARGTGGLHAAEE